MSNPEAIQSTAKHTDPDLKDGTPSNADPGSWKDGQCCRSRGETGTVMKQFKTRDAVAFSTSQDAYTPTPCDEG